MYLKSLEIHFSKMTRYLFKTPNLCQLGSESICYFQGEFVYNLSFIAKQTQEDTYTLLLRHINHFVVIYYALITT